MNQLATTNGIPTKPGLIDSVRSGIGLVARKFKQGMLAETAAETARKASRDAERLMAEAQQLEAEHAGLKKEVETLRRQIELLTGTARELMTAEIEFDEQFNVWVQNSAGAHMDGMTFSDANVEPILRAADHLRSWKDIKVVADGRLVSLRPKLVDAEKRLADFEAEHAVEERA